MTPGFMRLLTFCMLLLLLAGCGPADDGRVRIRIWHQKIGAERAFFEDAIAAYNAAHPDRVVEILYRENEELRNLFITASVGGQGPDLVFGPADNVSLFALTASIMPITEVLPDSFLAQFNDDGIVSWEGTPWFVADQIGNHLTFVYNKELMPAPPTTMDSLIAILKEVQQQEGVRYGLTWNYTEPFFFIPFLTCSGGWVMDDEGNPTLDTEATVRAIQFILDLRDKHRVIPQQSDYNVAETLFKDELAASIINGPWSWTGYGDAGVDYGLARIPRMNATSDWCAPVISAKGYSVNVNLPDERLPYVRDLLVYLTGPEMQAEMAAELATIPVIDAVRYAEVVQQNPVLQASLRQIEVGRPMPTAPQMRQIWDGMRGPYQLVMSGTISAEEGARRMQEEVEKRIADTFL